MVQIIPNIYWTQWFNTYQWEGYNIDSCSLPYVCQFTHDRSRLSDTSVVIFHASDVNDTKDMPPMDENRAWVYHNAEAPKNQYTIIDKMQYSMTYRLDSDFPWGYLEKDQLVQRLQKPVEMVRHNKRNTPVAWIVSNCKASNYRDHYVRELSKWIDVDIYGHCMNNQKYPDNTTAVELISQYHFYLSFENSNCKDYVTEKLTNTYLAGTIPIVDGPSDYGPFIPNTHSVIRCGSVSKSKRIGSLS